MKKYALYFRYVARHKWFVFIECVKRGIPLRGILHDWDKFLPSEFFPYAEMFYGNNKPIRDETGYYKPYDTGNEKFELAWLQHVNRNKHHWQYWVLPHDRDDNGNEHGCEKVFDIPHKYLLEMVCDWIGAGKAQKTNRTALEWYTKNKAKLGLTSKSARGIEKILAKIYT
jgi:hypothetical protein